MMPSRGWRGEKAETGVTGMIPVLFRSPRAVSRGIPGPVRTRLRAAGAGVLLLAAACGYGSAPAPPPAPVPPPPPAAVDPWRDVQVCVVDERGVREVPARYNVATGDTLVEGRPYAEVFPLTAAYAQDAEWFIDNEPIPRGPVWYGRYGLPRVILPGEIVRSGAYRGVMIFTPPGPGDPPEVLYAAVRPGCEFQPYSWDLIIGGVRG